MAQEERILQLCMEIGRAMLHNGSEIYRAQETMERVARAYGAADFHVYVLTNGLFASVEQDGKMYQSEVRHVRAAQVHLGRVAALNALSRDIEAQAIPLDVAFERLEDARSLPFKPAWQCVLACGVGAGCFAYIFGGTPLDAGVALLIGFVLQLFCFWLKKHGASKIIYNALAAGGVALCAVSIAWLAGRCGVSVTTSSVIIGDIIPLVPGMALTMSIRDFADGDYLSGTIRMIDALLVAGSIAIGVGSVFLLLGGVPGVWL